jgi:aminomethyltransferase
VIRRAGISFPPETSDMSDSLCKTALHAWHAANGGRMVEFAGWSMPVQYSSIVTEHNAVRTACGLFDIAHMGRLQFTGPDAATIVDRLVTCNPNAMSPGQVSYGLVCNESGGVLDDILVYKHADHWSFVVNASNREKMVHWIGQHRGSLSFEMTDQTTTHFMLAVQGPRSPDILSRVLAGPIADLDYYRFGSSSFDGQPVSVSRTGYTGEDGFEVMIAASHAEKLWLAIMSAGQSEGIRAAGLGCRDTLRLEAGMPLYGHELDEATDPYTAGLAFAVKLEGRTVIGSAALAAKKADANRSRRVGLKLAGKRIAREGATVLSGDQNVGRVTSGTFSPTMQQSIAMAYVSPEFSGVGTEVQIEVRGQRESAAVCPLPFYKRPR